MLQDAVHQIIWVQQVSEAWREVSRQAGGYVGSLHRAIESPLV